jgi:hypothetical protein
MAKKKASAPKTQSTPLAKKEQESHNDSLSHRKLTSKTKGAVAKNREASLKEGDIEFNPREPLWVSFGEASRSVSRDGSTIKFTCEVTSRRSLGGGRSLSSFRFLASLTQDGNTVYADSDLGITIDRPEETFGSMTIEFTIDPSIDESVLEGGELVVSYLTPKKLNISP